MTWRCSHQLECALSLRLNLEAEKLYGKEGSQLCTLCQYQFRNLSFRSFYYISGNMTFERKIENTTVLYTIQGQGFHTTMVARVYILTNQQNQHFQLFIKSDEVELQIRERSLFILHRGRVNFSCAEKNHSTPPLSQTKVTQPPFLANKKLHTPLATNMWCFTFSCILGTNRVCYIRPTQLIEYFALSLFNTLHVRGTSRFH